MQTPKNKTARGTSATTPALPNKLRIVGGQWRGRKLEFPNVAAIRPTPDRVRETLFNWLQQCIVGSRCLDLFAGSGALGLEALSRGASSVVFVEREPRIVSYLRETFVRLQAAHAQVELTEAENFLSTPKKSMMAFDIVFLDPPFAGNLLPKVCGWLETGHWLAPDALIYLECAAHSGPPALPSAWELIKSKTAGQVGYYLARRHSSDSRDRL